MRAFAFLTLIAALANGVRQFLRMQLLTTLFIVGGL